MAHEDLFNPYGTSSYSYVATQEKQYPVILPMYLSKVLVCQVCFILVTNTHTHTSRQRGITQGPLP